MGGLFIQPKNRFYNNKNSPIKYNKIFGYINSQRIEDLTVSIKSIKTSNPSEIENINSTHDALIYKSNSFAAFDILQKSFKSSVIIDYEQKFQKHADERQKSNDDIFPYFKKLYRKWIGMDGY